MQIVAVANLKGGVGKSTMARNLGALLAGADERPGRRVLLIDLDPQAALTAACGVGDTDRSLAGVLGGAQPGRLTLRDIAQPLSPTLALAPASIDLAASELSMSARLGRESILKKALVPVSGAYDLALIDCPPSLGLLTVNGLAAAQGVLIPTIAQVVDLRALRVFMNALQYVTTELNPTLAVIGVVATFFDSRLTHHNQALQAMREAGLPVMRTLIGRSVRVAEAAAAGLDVATFEPGNPQAQAYRELASEVNEWLQANAASARR